MPASGLRFILSARPRHANNQKGYQLDLVSAALQEVAQSIQIVLTLARKQRTAACLSLGQSSEGEVAALHKALYNVALRAGCKRPRGEK